METYTRLFTGLILSIGLSSSAVAANRPVTMSGINNRLDRVIQAQMAVKLQTYNPVSHVPSQPATKIRGFKLDGRGSASDRCPCFEYVYRSTPRKPKL